MSGAPSTIGALAISEEKKQYITQQVSPVLEELVTCLLTEMPEDPISFCHKWFGEKCGASDAGLKAQNDALRQSIVAMAAEAPTGGEEEDSEEEEWKKFKKRKNRLKTSKSNQNSVF